MTQKFPNPLRTEKIGEMVWKLIDNDFIYFVGDITNNDQIIVPIGFETDYASVPRVFWSIFPPDGKYSYAAVIHDYLYRTQTRTRLASDLIFKEASKEMGANWTTRELMYRALRIGGWVGWNKRKKELQDDTKNHNIF